MKKKIEELLFQEEDKALISFKKNLVLVEILGIEKRKLTLVTSCQEFKDLKDCPETKVVEEILVDVYDGIEVSLKCKAEDIIPLKQTESSMKRVDRLFRTKKLLNCILRECPDQEADIKLLKFSIDCHLRTAYHPLTGNTTEENDIIIKGFIEELMDLCLHSV